MPQLVCLGFGYSASALATRLLGEGWHVAGTCREEEKATRLAAQGIAPIRFGPGLPLGPVEEAIGTADAILSSVPPGGDGDPVLTALGPTIAARGRSIAWVGYLSTTGVYGNRDGGWVDEESPLEPATDRGRARVRAEAGWRELTKAGVPVHIFRLAGIYGPGRNALETIRAGKARRIQKPGQVFSRIHVEDIAAVLAASIARPNPGRVYNVCDDEPAPPSDVIAYACALLGEEPPPEVAFDEIAESLSPMARSFYAESKRVRNNRIKEELGVRLAHPDFRAGLTALRAQR